METHALFQQVERHLLGDETPADYLNSPQSPVFAAGHPFSMLAQLKGTQQSPQHHPEGDAWVHTLLVVNQAAARKGESSNPRALLWAALLHDIGKPETTRLRKGRITSYDHDKVGGRLARQFLQAICKDEEFISQVAALVRWHMQPLFVLKDMPFADIPAMAAQADLREVALLCLCDRMGRLHSDQAAEEKNRTLFLQKCQRRLGTGS